MFTNEKPLISQGFDASSRSLSASVGNTGDGTRTHDLRIMRPPLDNANDIKGKDLRQDAGSVSHHVPTDTCHSDPDLTAVVDAWDRLPEALRAGIVAMVKASESYGA
jgi:hypothetical protein